MGQAPAFDSFLASCAGIIRSEAHRICRIMATVDLDDAIQEGVVALLKARRTLEGDGVAEPLALARIIIRRALVSVYVVRASAMKRHARLVELPTGDVHDDEGPVASSSHEAYCAAVASPWAEVEDEISLRQWLARQHRERGKGTRASGAVSRQAKDQARERVLAFSRDSARPFDVVAAAD